MKTKSSRHTTRQLEDKSFFLLISSTKRDIIDDKNDIDKDCVILNKQLRL
jgi:hypothetical protein